MAFILPPDEVRQRLSFDVGGDTDAAIESALKTTEFIIASDLKVTSLTRASVTDVFRVMRDHIITPNLGSNPGETTSLLFHPVKGLRRDFPLTFTRLQLSRNLVDLAVTVNVYAATIPPYLSDPDLREDMRAAADGLDHVTVMPEDGYVDVDFAGLAGLYVAVEYDAGLFVNSDDTMEAAPPWLREAAYLKTVDTLATNPVIRSQEENPLSMDELRRQYSAIMTPHIRYEPMAVRPMSTS